MPAPHRSTLVRRAFTLVEVLIVVMILAILASIVVPRYTNAADDARRVSLKDQLRMLREQVNLYRSQHRDTFPGLDTTGAVGTPEQFVLQLTTYSNEKGVTQATKTAAFKYGPYLPVIPENPINNSRTVVLDETTIKPIASGSSGWIYQPLTGKLFVNTTGQDANGKDYIDY